jgi:hypothetical protein
MHKTRSRHGLAVLSCVGLIGLTACGTSPADSYKKTDPATIAAQAHDALKATAGVHLAGQLQLGNEKVTVDLTSDLTGATTGTATLADAGTVQVLATGGKSGRVYIKGGQDFWGKIAPRYAARLVNKWVLNVKPLPDVLRELTLPKLIANEAKYAWEREKPQLVGTGNVNGTPTVQINVTDGVSGAVETLDVSATDPHHVLRESEGSTFTLTFDQFGATVSAVEPSAADVVDLLKVLATK